MIVVFVQDLGLMLMDGKYQSARMVLLMAVI